MGMIDRIIGVGQGVSALGGAASGMAEIFTENATRRMELDAEQTGGARAQFASEFANQGWFDQFVNGLNRLPRPCLALGTLALFVYAMIEPEGFGRRMQGLNLVPEPLWWLLGAIVGFYFGAREAHYYRRGGARKPAIVGVAPVVEGGPVSAPLTFSDDFADNAALHDWARTMKD
jgi:hypothetical protein